jgi:hypothetical protein
MEEQIEVDISFYITPSDHLQALRRWNENHGHGDHLNFYIDIFLQAITDNDKPKFIELYRRCGKYLNNVYKKLSCPILFKDILINQFQNSGRMHNVCR